MDYKAEVEKAGRITIPIELRKKFDIAEGDILTIRQEDNELKIITQKSATKKRLKFEKEDMYEITYNF